MDSSDTPSIGPVIALPVQLAVIELLELLVILLVQREAKSSKDSGIKVKINAPVNDGAAINSWFQIEVQCVGIYDLAIQIKDFLKEHGSCLCHILTEMEKLVQGSFLIVKLPKGYGKESKSIKVRVFGEGKYAAMVNVTEEDLKQERRSVSFSFTVYQDFQRMLVECQGVYAYMHRLKITNPEFHLEFHLNIGDTKSKSDFWSGGSKSTFGANKIATDVRHFVNAPNDPSLKMKTKSGISSMLPPVHVCQNKPATNFRISSYAFLVPPPEAEVRSLSQMCTDLKVFLYGPCRVPLILPGVGSTGVSPTSLIKLSDYGLLLTGPAKSDNAVEKVEVQSDWHFKVQSAEAVVSDGPPKDEDQPQLCLCVIILLDSLKQDQDGQKSLFILDGLRQCLAHVLCKLRARIRKCTSSALNKLLHNYTKHDQKQEVYSTSISTITKSLTSMLKHSTNDAFRNACFSTMKVPDSCHFHDAVRDGLWTLATDRYGVVNPVSRESNTQQDDSCDAFAEVMANKVTSQHPLSTTAAESCEHPPPLKPSALPLDFFDILTRHRSPPLKCVSTSSTPLQAATQHTAQLPFAVGSKEQAADSSMQKEASSGQPTEYQRKAISSSGLGDAVPENELTTPPDSPVCKKRKHNDCSSTLQSDFFDALEFNIGFSSEVLQRRLETENSLPVMMTASKEDNNTEVVSESKMPPERSSLSSTEDWFNDILFE